MYNIIRSHGQANYLKYLKTNQHSHYHNLVLLTIFDVVDG